MLARGYVIRRLRALGITPTICTGDGTSPFVTDNGNLTLDCRSRGRCRVRTRPCARGECSRSPDVVDTGLFLGTAERVPIGREDGRVEVLIRASASRGTPGGAPDELGHQHGHVDLAEQRLERGERERGGVSAATLPYDVARTGSCSCGSRCEKPSMCVTRIHRVVGIAPAGVDRLRRIAERERVRLEELEHSVDERPVRSPSRKNTASEPRDLLDRDAPDLQGVHCRTRQIPLRDNGEDAEDARDSAKREIRRVPDLPPKTRRRAEGTIAHSAIGPRLLHAGVERER